MHHVLWIVRVIRGLGSLEFRTLIEFCQELLHDAEESIQVATRTVLHHERDTTICRESRNHWGREGQHLGILDMSRLDKDLGNHTCGIIRIEEETVDTITFPQTTNFPPKTLLTLTEVLQLDNESTLVGTCTSNEVVTLHHLTVLDSR